ncbi:MAG: hypothetical protein IJ640_00565 [Prevotella sp.]|nr:hypothetical protein [Prevotella sp.]
MKTLTLQITRDCFCNILDGQQQTEHRYIYPSTASRYILQHDNGDGTCDVELNYYEALRLINGRRKDAPRLLVEVVGADIIEYRDENGNVAKAKDKHGMEYYVYGIRYQLGRVISSKNTENLQRYRK